MSSTTKMFDDAIRLGFLVLGGLALAVAAIWYVTFLYQEIRGTGQFIIDPFTVVDEGGKGNDDLGKALAQMLQARLQSLVRELRDAQAGLTTNVSAAALAQAPSVAPVGDVRLWTQAVALQTGLLQPVEMKLSVGGVDVGGLLPWLQRRLSNRRTLHFTVYLRGDEAQIFGSIAALRLSDSGLRLSVKGASGKAPALDIIVDQLAHEIVRRHLGQDASNKLEVLDPIEFLSLAEVLVSAAQSNRRSILGRPAQLEFAALVPRITALADKVPDWPELGYLAARIADSGRESEIAVKYYQRVLPKFEGGKQLELVALINTRIAELAPRAAEPATASRPRPTSPLTPALDYSMDIKLVRDSGPEGSVVGLALATALEWQIARVTKENRQISGRHIYYVARQAGGLDLKADTGAQIADAISALTKQGTVEEAVWPYRAGEYAAKPPAAVEKASRFRITHARPLRNLDDVKRALKENGPVIAGIQIFEGALKPEIAKTGIIPLPTKTTGIVGGHAIVIVGYDDAQRRVKFVNSWGTGWGEHGFGYLPYEYVDKYMSDAWTFKLATA